jgi:hypothetical protein
MSKLRILMAVMKLGEVEELVWQTGGTVVVILMVEMVDPVHSQQLE